MRLDRYLSNAGLGSRSQVKQLLKEGHIRVNGETVRTPDRKIGPEDEILSFGIPVHFQEHVWYLLHKPAGVVTACSDGRCKTVMDLLGEDDRRRQGLFPVGRLDKDTTGLLLITDDGESAHRLLSPTHHVEKTYEVHTDRPLTKSELDKLSAGVDIGDDKPTLPAIVENCDGDPDCVYLTIREGRYHQVRRMCEAVGAYVVKLKRVQMGPLRLDEGLAEGEYRALSQEEIAALQKAGEKGKGI